MTHKNTNNYLALLSGGLDSTVAVASVIKGGGNIKLGLFFDYGQQAREKELRAASAIAEHYGIKLQVVSLGWLTGITTTGLISGDIPSIGSSTLDDQDITDKSARAVWVPNRNGIFINVAAAFAESSEIDYIITGFNREEAATFPDNSVEFIETASAALAYSTLNHVKVIAPVSLLDKTGIVKLAYQVNVPLNLIWSCYRGGEAPCGICESCLRLQRAMEAVG